MSTLMRSKLSFGKNPCAFGGGTKEILISHSSQGCVGTTDIENKTGLSLTVTGFENVSIQIYICVYLYNSYGFIHVGLYMHVFKFLETAFGSVAMSWTWNKLFGTLLRLSAVLNSARSPCQNTILSSKLNEQSRNKHTGLKHSGGVVR